MFSCFNFSTKDFDLLSVVFSSIAESFVSFILRMVVFIWSSFISFWRWGFLWSLLSLVVKEWGLPFLAPESVSPRVTLVMFLWVMFCVSELGMILIICTLLLWVLKTKNIMFDHREWSTNGHRLFQESFYHLYLGTLNLTQSLLITFHHHNSVDYLLHLLTGLVMLGASHFHQITLISLDWE